MRPCNREGIYKAEMMEYGLIESKDSSAVGIVVHAHLLDEWDKAKEEWRDISDLGVEAEGAIWIIKKDGSVSHAAAESLINHANWDGSLLSVEQGSWQASKFCCTVKMETYKQETRFRIAFINSLNRQPNAGIGNVSHSRAMELDAKYGSALGSLNPGDRPLAPPPKQEDDGSIPFGWMGPVVSGLAMIANSLLV